MAPSLPSIDTLLAETALRVHAIGAGGIGMAGLAHLLHALGHPVTGCDATPGRTSTWLATRGIPIAPAHSPDHIQAADWAIYSPACPPDHPELVAARACGIPLHRRGEVLPVLARRYDTLAVAGTHGKTTTSSLLAHILQALGQAPSYCIGGELPPDYSPARLGTGPHLVLEADESDGTLALYTPHTAIVTNVEPDHLEHFASPAALLDCFRTFAAAAAHLVACADDPAALALAREFPAKSILYTCPCDLSASPPPSPPLPPLPLARILAATPSPAGWQFTAELPGAPAPVAASLPLPGRHNLANALAALATAVAVLHLPAEAAAAAIATFRLPARRLEAHRLPDGHLVIADYAHHPTEIRAFLSAVRQQHPDSRLVAIFQPHRYTRTRYFLDVFPTAFPHVHHLVLAPVYAASEPLLPGGTSTDLHARFATCPSAPPSTLAPSLANALPLALAHLTRPTDILLLVGAGDIITLLPS